MPEQPQSVSRCAELREDCRGAIFEHIDARHLKVMSALTEIRETLAYQAGESHGRKDTGARDPVEAKKFPWREVGAAVALISAAVAAGCLAAWRLAGGGS